MTAYWLLLLFPAIMALTFPVMGPRYGHGRTQHGAMVFFVVFYTLLGGLRYQTGGDWINYDNIFSLIQSGSFVAAIEMIDPLFGALTWVSSRIGGGMPLVNGVCCWLLAHGTVSIAKRFREPWMAIAIAVPYLLIVVGFGYIRQGAAIGLLLMAMASLDRSRLLHAVVFLALATGFHSTAVFVHPIFAFVIAQRSRGYAVFGTAIGALIYLYFLAPRLDYFSKEYLTSGYGSAGATVRVLMGAIPAAFLLYRRNHFAADPQSRLAWLLMALGSLAALAALALSPSSTAVDRIALYFSIVQLVVYGQFNDLAATKQRNVTLVRLALLLLAGLVQFIWLVYADHSEDWVPYKSILQTIGS